MTPSPNRSATVASDADLAIADMMMFENNPKCYISEKKYYLQLIDFLYEKGYYNYHISIKELWGNK